MSTMSLTNVDFPAPKWYRKLKRIMGLLTGPAFLTFVQILQPSEKTMWVLGQCIAFLPTLYEIGNIVLSNGEEYAPKGTTDALKQVAPTMAATVQETSGAPT